MAPHDGLPPDPPLWKEGGQGGGRRAGKPRESPVTNATKPQDLPPEAKRALAEAAARRKKANHVKMPKELGGRDGPDPVRFGDWENKGKAVDF